MKAIGIDIGTTSICGVVIDVKSGKLISSKTQNSDAFLKGCAEWEKIQQVDKIMAVATEILDSFIDGDVSVIGVTGQMHGIVYFDSCGNAVSPLYTWQDGRGNLPYKDTTYAKYLNSCSGYGNVTDFYNKENCLRPKNSVGYCTIQDYLAMKLCGLKKPLIHSSNAASLGCYDLTSNSFNYDCNSAVTTDYTILGKYREIPVSVAIGDNQASVFSTLSNENNLLVNVGTGSQVSVVTDTVVEEKNIETRPYFEGKYLVVGSALCGGRAYSMLKDFYKEIVGYFQKPTDEEIYKAMNEMLKNSDKTPLEVNTRFAGTRSNADIKGSISGIGVDNFTPSHLTSGILHGMCNELFEMYKKMNVKKSGIVGSGNGLRKNASLVNVFENAFGAKMMFPAHLEEAAVGAALFALISNGTFKNANEAQKLIQYV
ncbi:MAG: hypothetical protein IKU45_01365 [Clostridia bacterium]|nr:hypothetical protein [Clostridia bacterium]